MRKPMGKETLLLGFGIHGGVTGAGDSPGN